MYLFYFDKILMNAEETTTTVTRRESVQTHWVPTSAIVLQDILGMVLFARVTNTGYLTKYLCKKIRNQF